MWKKYKKNEMNVDRTLKASFTVEASLIMMILLPALTALIYLSFYVHDSAVLQGISCEAAARGSCQALEKKNGELLKETKEQWTDSRFTALQKLQLSVLAGEEQIRVSGSGEISFPGLIVKFFGGNVKKVSKSWSRECFHPADKIRKIRGLKALADVVKEQ